MKNLFKFIAILIVINFFSSCSVYKMQVVSLDCNKLTKDSTWYYKDSIVEMNFFFYSNNGQLNFKIINNSDKPIFFDGKNSFLLLGNQKTEYWNDISQMKGTLAFNNSRHSYYSKAPVNASIARPERIVFIPPKTSYSLTKFYVAKGLYDLRKFNDVITDTVKANWNDKVDKKVAVKKINFQESNTPYNFRHFITLSLTEDFKNPLYYDFLFWISEIQEMDAKQATKSAHPENYCNDAFRESDTQNIKIHPFKKPWRFYTHNIPAPIN